MQDLHESTTVSSLERMASCVVRALPLRGQPHVFARARQPALAVEVCIKQRIGALPNGKARSPGAAGAIQLWRAIKIVTKPDALLRVSLSENLHAALCNGVTCKQHWTYASTLVW